MTPEELGFVETEEQENNLVEIIQLSEAAERMGQDTSATVSSGFDVLDNCLDGGFREGDFTVISGIPGEGKTTLARMLTLKFAEKNIPSLWFSHEMSYRELWDSFEKMGAKKDLISFVPESLEEDFDWMCRHMDVAIEKHGIKAIFIDTLGDIVKSVKKQQDLGNYATYLAQICKDLRKYAIKKNVMVFTVAHAIKQTSSGGNETKNSDIANSNGIAAASTNIFHVWRDTQEENVTYVKVGKSRRDGSKKDKRFRFVFKDHQLFEEEWHEPYIAQEPKSKWNQK